MEARRNQGDLASPWVLIVEDDPFIREELAEAIARIGQICWVADSLREARWQLANTAEFAVVLVDVCLPDGSGLELLQDVRLRPGRSPSVVIMSGHGSDSLARRVRRTSALEYLEKPVSLRRLRQVLTRAIRRQRFPG